MILKALELHKGEWAVQYTQTLTLNWQADNPQEHTTWEASGNQIVLMGSTRVNILDVHAANLRLLGTEYHLESLHKARAGNSPKKNQNSQLNK